MSVRLEFSVESWAVMTTWHSSVIDVGHAFADGQARHSLLGFFPGLAYGCLSAHDSDRRNRARPSGRTFPGCAGCAFGLAR